MWRDVRRMVLIGAPVGVVLGLLLVAALPRADRAVPRPAFAPEVTDLDARPVFEDGSIPTTWRVAGFSDPAGFLEWLRTFQGWVANGDRERVLGAVRLPLHQIKTREALEAKYDELFSEPVRRVVAKAKLNRIWRNYQGAMIGSGVLWFGEAAEGDRVSAINPDAATLP